MKTSTGKPTKSEAARFAAIKETGCVACLIEGKGYVPCEIHHLTETGRHGGKRRGHHATVGLCPWHHRGAVPIGLRAIELEGRYGPSLARSPRSFRARYGEDDELLRRQEALLSP